MPDYLFLLGREPMLSLAELCSYVRAERIGGTVQRLGFDVASVQTESVIDPSSVVRRLGGTIKIGQTIGRFEDFPADPQALADILVLRLEIPPEAKDRKFVFGLSVYPSRPERRLDLKSVAARIKESLKQDQVASRYVLPTRGNSLSSAQTAENRLTSHGVELLLAKTGRGFILAKTVAVQSLEEETRRDMEKPQRRLREGLLPPKIARIMVNLSRSPDTASLLDPFCGSGVVLMEAALLGLKPIGSDISAPAVASARENLEWLLPQLPQPAPTIQTFQADVEELSLKLPPLSVDTVATEPYLGPPLTAPLTDDKAQKLSESLRNLYTQALAEIRTVLRPGGRCVIILPLFQTRRGSLGVDVKKDLPFIGFREYNPLVDCLGVEGCPPLRHERPGQKVRRKILVLENHPE